MNNDSNTKTTVARYLVQRLQELGLDHFFCVPGNFLGGLLDVLGEVKDEITRSLALTENSKYVS